MGRTITPDLAPDVLERLYAYALEFRPLFGRSDRFKQGRLYLHGLLLDGERKSIEPLSRRVPGGNEQNLQQFVNQSPWDPAPVLAAYRARMAAAFASPDGLIVVDDTSFPKQGKHTVGVARQYCGALGKAANCQVAVSLHYAGRAGDYPLALRLYLPEAWTGDPARLDRARVPVAERTFKTKWEIALELLDEVRAEGLPHRLVVADAGYGAVTEFREGLEARQERYIVGLLGSESVFTEPPTWVAPEPSGTRGRPRTRAHLAAEAPRPIAVKDLAERLGRTTVRWREGTKGWLEAEFAWVRVRPAHRWGNGVPAEAIPDADEAARWLLVEWRADGTIKYALSNLPPETTLEEAVGWWKERWQVERGYLQLKDELGLDHFEGRSWAGFHHHATMTFLAYGFLALERQRAAARPSERVEPPGEGRRGA
ncbi:MAG TPA: IS701 family transposase [Chloroflexota bacterium]|nr:IS701 family transposase [Chloroflexota bacterium]